MERRFRLRSSNQMAVWFGVSRPFVDVAAAEAAVGAFALDAGSLDAAMVLDLEPGEYTAIVSGIGGATGYCVGRGLRTAGPVKRTGERFSGWRLRHVTAYPAKREKTEDPPLN